MSSDLSTIQWLQAGQSPFPHEHHYASAVSAAERVKQVLLAWRSESKYRVAKPEPYWIEQLKSEMETPLARNCWHQGGERSDEEHARKRDLLVRYSLGRWSGIIVDHKNKNRPSCDETELSRAIVQLQREVDAQNTKNQEMIHDLPTEYELDYQADLEFVNLLVAKCNQQGQPMKKQKPLLTLDLLDSLQDGLRCHHCDTPVARHDKGQVEMLPHHLGPAPTCTKCGNRYCRSCLHKIYEYKFAKMNKTPWLCPRCDTKCWCAMCIMLQRCKRLKQVFLT